MSDYELGCQAYEDDQLWDQEKSEEWRNGYVKSVENALIDLLSMSAEETE